jgi:hypothetical protein
MDVVKTASKLSWHRKKAGWLTRFAGFLGRSRKLTLFAGLVALLGGARGAQKRLSHG